MIYLDNAATTGKKPSSVINAVNYALTNLSAHPGRSGHALSLKAAEAVFNVRRKLAKMYNCEPTSVCFTQGCTTSLNMAIANIPNGHIACSNLEHNSVLRPLQNKNYSFFNDHPKEVVRPDTVAVICTHASNVSGKIFDIENIAKYCKEKGLMFIVDAAQTAGVLDIDSSNIDYLCIAAHKGLYAPMGIGILIANKEPKKVIIKGGTGSASQSLKQPDFLPDMLESGTINVPGILGVSAGIEFIKNKSIYEHELYLTKPVYEALLNNKKITVVSSKQEKGVATPIVSFNINGKKSEEIAQELSKRGIATRGGYHCSLIAHKTLNTENVGAVRLSPSVFNNKNEMQFVLNEIYKIAKQA